MPVNKIRKSAVSNTLGLSHGPTWAGMSANDDGSGVAIDADGTVRYLVPTGVGTSVTTATAVTLTAGDNGRTFLLDSEPGVAITLPAPAAHYYFRFFIKTVAGSGHTTRFTPATGDTIYMKGLTAAASKYVEVTQATQAVGDYITLKGIDADTWAMTSTAACTVQG